MEASSLRDKISSSEGRSEQPRWFQSGITYRSLCVRCNTELLGAKYDPALGEFSAQVRALANSPLALPAAIDVMIKPQPIMRSVLGHIAAQGVERYQKGPYTEPIRDYLLDADLPLPSLFRMYYWLYPFRSQVLVRDASRIERLGSGQGGTAFWLMKFYPLAFMVTLNEPPQRLYRMENLDRFANIPFTQQTSVRLSLRPLVPCRWPEYAGGPAAVLYGPQAMVADPLQPRQ